MPARPAPLARRLAGSILLVVLPLTGCLAQPEEANDNGPPAIPDQPPVVRTPGPVETAPLTVDPPGPTRSP